MTGFARPRVVLSRCLELDKVRYDGEKIAYGFVLELEPHVRRSRSAWVFREIRSASSKGEGESVSFRHRRDET